MKTGHLTAVAPVPLDLQGRQAPHSSDQTIAAAQSVAQAVRTAVAASAGSSTGQSGDGQPESNPWQQAAPAKGEMLAPGMAGDGAGAQLGGAASAAGAAARVDGVGGTPDPQRGTRETVAAQRIGLSRLRLESLMLEAQAASAQGDAERARSISRAVKMEAGAVRRALRAASDPAGAPVARSEDVAAVVRAAEEARSMRRGAGRTQAAGLETSSLAPWSRGPTTRDAMAAEAAPHGVPTTSLHREAYEALLRAQEILRELAGITGGAAFSEEPGDGGGRALLNRTEAEDGALLDGYNLLA